MRKKLEIVGLVVVSVVMTLAMMPLSSWMTAAFQSPVSPVSPLPTPGPVYEAEYCALYGRFAVEESLTASGGEFVHVPDGAGDQLAPSDDQRVTCLVAVAEAGEYHIGAWVAAADEKSDSFFVRVDGWPEPGALWDISAFHSWAYDLVNARDGSDPLVFDLAAGDHRVDFYLREDGAQLDNFEMVAVAGLTPTPVPLDLEWHFADDLCPDIRVVYKNKSSLQVCFASRIMVDERAATLGKCIDGGGTLVDVRQWSDYYISVPLTGTHRVVAQVFPGLEFIETAVGPCTEDPDTPTPTPTDTPCVTPVLTDTPVPTREGEWYDSCPDCSLSTPQPTYTPEPTPTCLPCVSPTPYPTSTPFPPQPTFAPP